ncbi:MAG: hypothetical protein M1831_003773 [Alyxoria varia]|nr:MAG: hypothetical protein M1831_003773 [Alyxoria varia]
MHIIQTQSATLTNAEALAHVQEVDERYRERKGYEDRQTARFKGLCRTVGEVQRYFNRTPASCPTSTPLPATPQYNPFQSSHAAPSSTRPDTPGKSTHANGNGPNPPSEPSEYDPSNPELAAPLPRSSSQQNGSIHPARSANHGNDSHQNDRDSSTHPQKKLTQHMPHLLERLSRDYPCLLKRERLAICNVRPTDETQLGVIVEDLEVRMDERELEGLVGFLGEVFAGGGDGGG